MIDDLPYPLSRPNLERLYDELNRFIEETPVMPVPVSEMTANEYALFEQLARACGIMLYLRGRVATTLAIPQCE
jgi:hypothetical protein